MTPVITGPPDATVTSARYGPDPDEAVIANLPDGCPKSPRTVGRAPPGAPANRRPPLKWSDEPIGEAVNGLAAGLALQARLEVVEELAKFGKSLQGGSRGQVVTRVQQALRGGQLPGDQ